MNFSENIRIGLTNVAAGLTNLGHSLENMHKRHYDWHQESQALGLISDEEKLRMLKAQLYRVATAGKMGDNLELQRLTSAIETLEEIKATELKHRYSFPVQLEVFTNTCIILLIAGILSSYLVSFTCGNSRSMFCGYARSTVYPINKFFQD